MAKALKVDPLRRGGLVAPRRSLFDPSKDFVVITPNGIKAFGEFFPYLSVFKKDLVNERTLRQLYDSKSLAFKGEEGTHRKPVTAPKKSLPRVTRSQVNKGKSDGGAPRG